MLVVVLLVVSILVFVVVVAVDLHAKLQHVVLLSGEHKPNQTGLRGIG